MTATIVGGICCLHTGQQGRMQNLEVTLLKVGPLVQQMDGCATCQQRSPRKIQSLKNYTDSAIAHMGIALPKDYIYISIGATAGEIFTRQFAMTPAMPCSYSWKRKIRGLFGDKDWLVYNRCNIFNHAEQGFGSVDVYDAIPSTGKFTVFTLSNYGRRGGVEDQGLCPELDQVRDKRIKWRNPNLRIVSLPLSDMWVDFARLVFAPNVINPSAGSSWTLWSLLANSGNVKTVPHHGGPGFPAMNVSIYPPNFEVLKTSVLYPPEFWPETRQCVQFRLLNSSDPVHREKLLRCFDKNPKMEVIPRQSAKRGQGKQNETILQVSKKGQGK